MKIFLYWVFSSNTLIDSIQHKRNSSAHINKIEEIQGSDSRDINLYLGNEIFMDEDIYELLGRGEITTLNGSKYLLIELPMSG